MPHILHIHHILHMIHILHNHRNLHSPWKNIEITFKLTFEFEKNV